MADKELTVFLLDASVSSSAYKYVFDTLAGKLLKGLKTDFVTVVLFNSTRTKHAHAGEGKFLGIEVLLEFESVSFENLRMLENNLRHAQILNKYPAENNADVVQAVLFTSTLFQPTIRKKFVRNLILVSDAGTSFCDESMKKVEKIPAFYGDLQVRFYGIAAGFNQGLLEHTSLGDLRKSFPSGSLFSEQEASRMLECHPPIRKIRPIATYVGEMRLGSDFESVINHVDHVSEGDKVCVSFRVELYPAAKGDTQDSDTHQYIVESDRSIVRLEKITSNYVWDRNLQDERESNPSPNSSRIDSEKKAVDARALTPAFKFSNFDLLALDEDLLKATKLPLFSSFDIFGFIPAKSLPYEYFTDESNYVVPEKASSMKNIVNFQAFIEALSAKNLAALCRLVRKSEKEVEVGAAFPVKVKVEQGHVNCFVFIRLPFREDEKIGRFPPLAEKNNVEEDFVDEKQAKKNATLQVMMDKFVKDKNYDSDTEGDEDIEDFSPTNVIDNFKVTMKLCENSKLALPPKHMHVGPFLRSSPSANRYQKYLREILLRSLSAQNWISHFENPDFISQNLRDDPSSTNFFNLENCLAVNAPTADNKWLLSMNKRAMGNTKRLAQESGVKYVRKVDTKKKKFNKTNTNFYHRGNYGADEGTYDEVPEFDF